MEIKESAKDELTIKLTKIKEILEKNDLLIKSNVKDEKINYISYNSKEIEENTLFICKGQYFKKEYLIEAIQKGIKGYISEIDYNIDGVSYFIVKDILKTMGRIAMEFYGNCCQKLNKIGITGTKGKTTVTYFLYNIMKEYKKEKIGLISSIDLYCGDKFEKSTLTTPESMETQKYFYNMVNNNIKNAVIEVSSQGYKRSRLEGVEFEYGMFLNIGIDHISEFEHPDFEDYLNCKLEFLKHCKNIVVNIDSEHLDDIKKSIEGKNILYFGKNKNADYYVENILKTENGYTFDVKNEKTKYCGSFQINLSGEFNVINALAAITMSKMLGIDDETIRNGLLRTAVEGRMNIFENKGKIVIVDYAHNELSYRNLFESIKKDYPNSKIISVGGAVGGKAYNRRAELGRIVGEYSDYIILTTDDPQFENVYDICKDITKFIADKHKCKIIIDRKTAVKTAINKARYNDVVVLLSKGGDKYQRIKNIEVPYESDIVLAKKFLKIVGEENV